MGVLGIGVVGCGNIAGTYLRNAAMFAGVELRACADLSPDASRTRAEEFGVRSLSVDALLRADDVDLVLNLTVPNAHFGITMAALNAGKHVFTEKPLATTATQGRRLVEEARRMRRVLGSAPDTFLGAAGRLARRLVDEGAIGTPLVGTAFMMTRGMEHWHPNPAFYYQPGGGPMLDMGPYYLTMLVNLLGPVQQVTALAAHGSRERTVTAPGPLFGTTFPVDTATTVTAALRFANGTLVTVVMSWDVFRHGNPPIELHGTEGSLRLPDPDTFGGTVAVSKKGSAWRDIATDSSLHGVANWPFAAPDRANYRMLGVADLAQSLATDTRPRASGGLALHVLEVMEAMFHAAASGSSINVDGKAVVRPKALPEADAQALMTGS